MRRLKAHEPLGNGSRWYDRVGSGKLKVKELAVALLTIVMLVLYGSFRKSHALNGPSLIHPRAAAIVPVVGRRLANRHCNFPLSYI